VNFSAFLFRELLRMNKPLRQLRELQHQTACLATRTNKKKEANRLATQISLPHFASSASQIATLG
jgi:hypothetical protein